jgi:hypothetical protein
MANTILEWFSSQKSISFSHRISFEDMQHATKNNHKYCIINTLALEEQDCLIASTISASTEEKLINEMLTCADIPDKIVILYGKNMNDISVENKFNQLQQLGVMEIYVYSGGLFEWLLLQDVYGHPEFPTTQYSKTVDILKYKPSRTFL